MYNNSNIIWNKIMRGVIMQIKSLAQNNIYLFHRSIAANIYSTEFDRFLTDKKLRGTYLASEYYAKRNIVDFINEKIIEKEIDKNDINNFLPKQLSFGKHKQVFYYKFKSGYDNTVKSVSDNINLRFGIKSMDYNELANAYYREIDGEDENLAYVNVLKEDNNKVLKLRLIFVKKVKYKDGNVEKYENSYFPIDIDFESNYFVIKSMIKDYINLKEYKSNTLAQEYAKKIISMLNLQVIEDKSGNQTVLYNMCNKLLDKVISEVSKLGMKDLDSLIEGFAETIKEEIKKKLSMPIKTTGALNEIKPQVKNIIENIIVPLILIDNKQIDGLISYIKFRDRTAVKAVLKTKRRNETLLDSEAYLNLRETLKKSNYVQKIRVIWNEKELSLYYDASRDECVEFHFYRKILKADVDYAIKRFEEHR